MINIPILGLVILPTVWSKAVLPDQRSGSVEEFCFIWKRLCFSRRQCRGPYVPSPRFLSTKHSRILPKASEMFLCKLLSIVFSTRGTPGDRVVQGHDWGTAKRFTLFEWDWLRSDPLLTPQRTWGSKAAELSFLCVDDVTSVYFQ